MSASAAISRARRRQVLTAIDEIAAIPRIDLLARSSLYSSPPLGPPDQPHYINAVVKLSVAMTSDALLDALQRIERAHGRIRDHVRWGPRTLDLDVLLFGDECSDGPHLTLPHPGLKERDFVVLPLQEIAPGLVLPCGTRVDALARDMAASPGATPRPG